jgi:hypothetical protein
MTAGAVPDLVAKGHNRIELRAEQLGDILTAAL